MSLKQVVSGAVVWAALVLALALPPSLAAQTMEPLTVPEWEAARALSRAFMERYHAIGTLGPLIDEFFVDDLPLHLRQSRAGLPTTVNNGILYPFRLTPELAGDLTDAELQSYFVAAIDFWYLTSRYVLEAGGLGALQTGAGIDAAVLPEAFVERLREDPTLAPTIEGGDRTPVGEIGVFRRAQATVASALTILGRGSSASETFLALMAGAGARLDQAGPTLIRTPSIAFNARACSACEEGARRLEVTALPGLHLHLVTEDGRLKIETIDLPFD